MLFYIEIPDLSGLIICFKLQYVMHCYADVYVQIQKTIRTNNIFTLCNNKTHNKTQTKMSS